MLYKRLPAAELPLWQAYLGDRVRAKGWGDTLLLGGLARLPRSVPQGHRWFLLKLPLNAPMTTARVGVAGVLSASERCVFCDQGCDSLAHLAQCPAVLAAYDAVANPGSLPHLRDTRDALLFNPTSMAQPRIGLLRFSRQSGTYAPRPGEEPHLKTTRS